LIYRKPDDSVLQLVRLGSHTASAFSWLAHQNFHRSIIDGRRVIERQKGITWVLATGRKWGHEK
jgi:hypothetical protein